MKYKYKYNEDRLYGFIFIIIGVLFLLEFIIVHGNLYIYNFINSPNLESLVFNVFLFGMDIILNIILTTLGVVLLIEEDEFVFYIGVICAFIDLIYIIIRKTLT